MEEKFQKYIEGKANEEEVNSVILNLISEDESEVTEKHLLDYWSKCMGSKAIKPLNREFINGVYAKLGVNPRLTKRLIIYKALSYASVFLLAIIVIGRLFFYQPNVQAPKVYTQTINTPFGARTNFDLPDGSKVWLNSGSTISFPSYFVNERLVELTGEAFFEVEKSDIPFVVSTEHGNIEVLGTEFNISAYDEELFQTTLITGKVKVIDANETFLQPGYQYSKEKDKQGKVFRVDTKMYTSWKDGELVFKNEPLKNVVKRLERWYNVKIYLENKSLENLKYTGTIRMESFSEVLEVLKVTSSIQYSFNKETRGITITRIE